MAGTGKKGRLASAEESQVTLAPLEEDDTLDSMAALSKILDSCYGPEGLFKSIHNNSGGHVSVTSQSTRLLQCVQFTQPVVRLLATALQGHVTHFMDQGLFAGRFALYLIRGALHLGFHRHLVIQTFSLLSSVCDKYLDSSECEAKFKLSEEASYKMRELMTLVQGVISTKTLCGLSDTELTHICKLAVETYLTTCSIAEEDANKRLHYIQLEGYRPSECSLVDGFLYETPRIPVYASQALSDIVRVPSGADRGRIRTLLTCVSLAGDSDEFPDVTYEMEERWNLADAVVEKLMHFAEELLRNKVGVLLCQKVVHPEVRQCLESGHVIVLDRLGSAQIELVHNLTGGDIVRSVSCGLSGGCYGYVDDALHCVYGERSYVQLTARGSSVATVVLANRSEESLAELKAVFAASQQVLHLSERAPWYLAGAGCWQTTLANYVEKKGRHMLSTWSEELEAPLHTVQPMINCFTSSLVKAALPLAESGLVDVVDTSFSHRWRLPTASLSDHTHCACGLIAFSKDLYFKEIIGSESSLCDDANRGKSQHCKRQCEVMDCFVAGKNAVQCGVAIATMIIGVAHVVKDSN